MALALPLYASGQSLSPAQAPHAVSAQTNKNSDNAHAHPLWQGVNGQALSILTDSQPTSAAIPAPGTAALEPRAAKADTGLQLNVSPSVY
ncbi:MAG: hypothetical protein ACREMY_25490, partial [bacterium]